MTFGGYNTGYGEAVNMTRYVWDCSSYDWGRDPNHQLNFAAARKDGISGVTHKSTEGTSFTDPNWAQAAPLMKAAGFPVLGAYHVLWPNDTTQTDHWFNVVKASAPWWSSYQVFTWQIDAEKFSNMPRQPNLSEIHACGARLEQLGVDPAAIIVYAPQWLYGNSLKGLRYKLWSSSYGGNPAQHYRTAYPGDSGQGWAPYGGTTPTLWQYGSQTIIGEQHTCDASAVRVASEADLQALFRGGDDVGQVTGIDAAVLAQIADTVLKRDGVIENYGNPADFVSLGTWSSQLNTRLKKLNDATVAQIAAAVVAALPPAQAGGLTVQQVEDACRAALTDAKITPA